MKVSKRKRDAVSPAKRDAESPSPAPVAQSRRFVLPASCTVRDSVALRTALLELSDEPLPIVLDIAAIERIDTAAIQVLCAFMRDRLSAGLTVSLTGQAEPFREAAQLLGVQRAFDELTGVGA